MVLNFIQIKYKGSWILGDIPQQLNFNGLSVWSSNAWTCGLGGCICYFLNRIQLVALRLEQYFGITSWKCPSKSSTKCSLLRISWIILIGKLHSLYTLMPLINIWFSIIGQNKKPIALFSIKLGKPRSNYTRRTKKFSW